MRLVLSSAIEQFCRPYKVEAHTRGESSSPEPTMAERRDSATAKRWQASEELLSIRWRERRGERERSGRESEGEGVDV